MLRQKLNTSTRQSLNLSARQIQLMNFIQLNSFELDRRIMDEISDNPALLVERQDENLPEASETESANDSENGIESEDRIEMIETYLQDDNSADFQLPQHSETPEIQDFNQEITEQDDFRKHLKSQLGMIFLTEKEKVICNFIIESLSDDGYLRTNIEELCDDISFSQQTIFSEEECNDALEVVRSLEPAGIAAYDLQSCMTLQLECLPFQTPGIQTALIIVEQHLEEWANQKNANWPEKLGCSESEYLAAVRLIKHLNPFPVGKASITEQKNQNIIPDYIVERNEAGTLIADILKNDKQLLRINPEMQAKLEQLKAEKVRSKENQYIHSKLDSALWFLEMIQQREDTMRKTIHAILAHQPEYFNSGDKNLIKPMILKDIALATGLDVSTISRVTSGKYALTDFGIVSLKNLFQKGISKKNGDIVNVHEIRTVIATIIRDEDPENPLSDNEIMNLLHSKGYKLARRTVSKYRNALKVASAKDRQL
jgi:RNA polymerase sigma-54 factor